MTDDILLMANVSHTDDHNNQYHYFCIAPPFLGIMRSWMYWNITKKDVNPPHHSAILQAEQSHFSSLSQH